MTSITINSLGYIFQFLKRILKSLLNMLVLHIHRFELDASPVFSDNTSRYSTTTAFILYYNNLFMYLHQKLLEARLCLICF